MPISPAALRVLAAAGVSPTHLVDVVEAQEKFERDWERDVGVALFGPQKLHPRDLARLRRQHHRERVRLERPPPKYPTSLYVIASVVDGAPSAPVKVGMSHNVTERLSDLQSGSPLLLVLVEHFQASSRDVAIATERQLHEGWSHLRLHGEWFRISPTDAVLGVRRALEGGQ